MKSHQTTVALIDNLLEKTTWIVLVDPKTSKKMAMPCNDPNNDVMCRTKTALPNLGTTVIRFDDRELREFYKIWKNYKRKVSMACDKAGYGPDDYKIS